MVLMGTMTALSSCRSPILEDRTACPAYLFFEFTDRQSLGDPESIHVEAVEMDDGAVLNAGTTTVGEMADGTFYLPIHKCNTAGVFGMAGYDRSRTEGASRWVIPKGEDGDRLYHFQSRLEATAETAVVPVEMTKEHCRITVRFKRPEADTTGVFPYSVVATSNTCGTDIRDGSPVPGDYRFAPEETQEGVFRFTVPRQGDHSLALEIWSKPDSGNQTEHVDDLVLWDYLERIEDFDWNLKNLPDLTVEIDWFQSEITLFINDWGIGISTTYEI